MISPVKLYKHDMANQRVPTTAGPHGLPASGCSGSLCYRHKHVDWTVHRLSPALMKRGGKVEKFAVKHAPNDDLSKRGLLSMSPRWGPGLANRTRKQVPLPRKSSIQAEHVGRNAAIGVGVAAAGVGGYEAYKHRAQIKDKVQSFKHAHAFHSTRKGIGA